MGTERDGSGPLDSDPPASRRLPGGVTEAALRQAVARNRSWRGVLRDFGMSAPRNGRRMRAACDELGISYEHFSGTQWEKVDEQELRDAISSSDSWGQVMERLSFAPQSGSARASLRRSALQLGLDIGHLSGHPRVGGSNPFSVVPDDENIRRGAALLVAAKCTLMGHRVSWPLEPQPYDLLVDTEQAGMLRVQVKSSTCFAHGSWVVRMTKERSGPAGPVRVPYTPEEVDYFAIVDAEQQVYMLPIDVVEGKSTVCLSKYEDYRIAC